MSSPTKVELLDENKRLRAQVELLEAAVNQELTIRELAAKMEDDGSINVRIINGEKGISHPGIRVLATAALSLLELDGTVPPNYRTAQMSGTLASGESYFVEMAACKSKDPTPHKLRMKAEAERDAFRDPLARSQSIVDEIREMVKHPINRTRSIALLNGEKP